MLEFYCVDVHDTTVNSVEARWVIPPYFFALSSTVPENIKIRLFMRNFYFPGVIRSRIRIRVDRSVFRAESERSARAEYSCKDLPGR